MLAPFAALAAPERVLPEHAAEQAGEPPEPAHHLHQQMEQS
jgi:hypothetical protein